MLYIMNCQIVIARKTDKIMLVALMIAHEDILAVQRTVVMPPSFRLLNGLSLGVVIGGERNVVLF
jgi:hypothetical protein